MGFAGVEISAGHGHLFHQFLSPWSNRRDDEYGGVFERRLQLLRDLVGALRAACGPQFVVGLKLPGDDGVPQGIGPELAAEIARALCAGDHVDYVCFTWGSHGRTGREFAGVEHVLFDSIGVDIVYGTSGLVEMMSGLMRSSEIAAWHLAAALCLAVGGVVTAARLRTRLVLAALAGGLFIALLLTGRRKMLAEVALFALFFVLLLAARRGRAPVGLRWSFAALLAAALAFQLVSRGRVLVLVPYVQRGVTVVAESTQRLEGMTVGQLGSIVSRTGFLGLGAGTDPHSRCSPSLLRSRWGR